MDLDVGPVEEGAEVVDVALHLRLKGDAQVGLFQLVKFWNKGVCSFAVLQSTNGHINVHVRQMQRSTFLFQLWHSRNEHFPNDEHATQHFRGKMIACFLSFEKCSSVF